MLDLFRAEVRKILGNRWIAALLVWLWPILGIALPLVLVVLLLLTGSQPERAGLLTFQWTDTALSAWTLPTNLLGRLLILSLAAWIFAGEYGWGTWKTIVPRAGRVQLVLAKYLAFAALVIAAFAAMSVLLAIGVGIIQAVRGMSYPPAPTPEVIQTFIRDYLLQAGLTVVNTLISVAFAAVAATLTRSILGGIVGGMLFIFGEVGFIAGTTVLALYTEEPPIAGLARLTSGINIANISSWVRLGHPVQELVAGAGINSLEASFVVLAVWVIGLIAVNLYLFHRQDLA